MKIIVNALLALICVFALNAQTYAPDELIIEYDANATTVERQAVRNLYGITNSISIGEDLELWKSISFPLPVTENGSTIVINNVEELLEYIIEIQTNDHGTNNATANINDGTLNFTAELINDGILHEDGTFDPLPLCNDIHNSRLIGPDQSGAPFQNRLKIIIIDQAVSGINNVTLETSPDEIGGAHGNKVYSVINNILTQAGITEVEYMSLVLFDDQGQSSLSSLTSAFEYIQGLFHVNGPWNKETDRVIVNLSANIVFPDDIDFRETIGAASSRWETCIGHKVKGTVGDLPVMLVSSAGNHGTITRNVFPASFGYTAEISVAGTESCFSQPWGNTNHDPVGFEIAAEAEAVLTENSGLYYLSDGTSYSSAEVTAVAAQIALNRITSDITQIQEHVLNAVDHVPALENTVEAGRVINIGNHLWFTDGNGGNSGGFFLESDDTSSPLTLQTTPNPFSQNAIVNIGVAVGQSPHLSLYNSIGQLVHQEVIPNQQELTELQWYTPDQLARGTYLLRVQVGDKLEQQIIVKQ